jgi:hypothetical protein
MILLEVYEQVYNQMVAANVAQLTNGEPQANTLCFADTLDWMQK